MVVELKRMLQRRGLKSEIPNSIGLRDGEFYVALDTKELYFTSENEYVKTLTGSDVINELNSFDSSKVLSANMGRELDTKLNNLNSYWQTYINNAVQDIENKQDKILERGSTPPSNTNLFWQRT